MAHAVTPVDPSAVEEALAELWRDAAAGGVGVTRALMSNLVVYAPGADAAPDEVLDDIKQVGRHHPSRVIVLHHDDAGSGQSEIATAVAIQTYEGDGTRYGVDQVFVKSRSSAEALVSLLRRLLVGDVPTSLWWTPADLPRGDLVRALAPLGRQFIYDSLAWSDPLHGMRIVAPLSGDRPDQLDLADLAWRRLQPVRRAVVHALEPVAVPSAALHRLQIAAPSHAASLAWLLVGWFAARLGWRTPRRGGGHAHPSMAFDTPQGSVTAELLLDDATTGVTVAIDLIGGPSPDAIVRVTLEGDEIRATYETDMPPFAIKTPLRARHDMLAAELRNLHLDPYLHETVATLARLAS